MAIPTISEEQVACYNRDGAVLLKGVLSAAELDWLVRGVEESYNNPGKRFSRAASPTGKGETFLETFPSQHSPSLRKLLECGRIPEIAGRMMQVSSAQLVLDQIFYKKAGHVNGTPWHQDTPYLRVRGDDMVRIWLSADDSPKELTLQVIRGSHRWGIIFDPRPRESRSETIRKTGEGKMFALKSENTGRPRLPNIAKYPESFDIMRWDVEPGDALVFNGNMLHAAGSTDNHPTPRRAYASMWGGPALRYVKPGDNAIPTLADVNGFEIPDGALLGDYPEAFPVGWRA